MIKGIGWDGLFVEDFGEGVLVLADFPADHLRVKKDVRKKRFILRHFRDRGL